MERFGNQCPLTELRRSDAGCGKERSGEVPDGGIGGQAEFVGPVDVLHLYVHAMK
jgi:hypothetical protein